ncbi:hypothetical protein EOD42_16500 [Rhodovarius crocodyli]|uniref:Uncharacterized protein n=1 Tax=Rhodovarius crocodyli TaxID=1979269 RepID=A0A437MDT2_9PROT|nr:hypothetical protein [Rhodovarius crocodyli]RVT95788.1 hypothetical protein EOD42_16500 [Rhodovarius crocodyli]
MSDEKKWREQESYHRPVDEFMRYSGARGPGRDYVRHDEKGKQEDQERAGKAPGAPKPDQD